MPDRVRLSELLAGHHRSISSVLAKAKEALEHPEATRAVTLASLRWQLLRLLREYQLFKHIEIFDRVIADDDPSGTDHASAMKERCIAASDAYERHVRKWSLEGIADWPAYRSDKIAVLQAIKSHLLREEIEIRTLMSIAPDNLRRKTADSN